FRRRPSSHSQPESDLNGACQAGFTWLNAEGDLPSLAAARLPLGMTRLPRPPILPARPWFSSGPTAKPPGWRVADLSEALMGRSIRAPDVLDRFRQARDLTRAVLEIPPAHLLCFLPASDTGAVEAALWNLLGERKVQ